MNLIFLNILNMSLLSIYVVLFILLLRIIFRKFSKSFFYFLWIIVFLKLIVPFSVHDFFKINIKSSTVNTIIDTQTNMNLDILSLNKINIPSVDISNSVSQNTGYSFEKYISSISYLWIFVVFIMIVYNILSYIRLKNKLIGAIKLEKNIYLADYIKTPFVIGLFKPKIYLPSIMKEDEIKSVILHEKVHIKRWDYIIKIIAFLIAIIYWFNPFVWLAYLFLVKDMEMSCDEVVIKKSNYDIREEYSSLLLKLSIEKSICSNSVLAFGEKDIKERIKNIMNYKKQARWITVVAVVILAIVVAVILVMNPIKEKNKINITEHNVDISDIEEMFLATDMPYILYGDNEKVVITGSFGFVVYNMKNKKLTNRVAYDQIEIKGMALVASVSKDGEKIYFAEAGMDVKPPHYYKYEYIIKEDKINEIEPILFEELDVFETENIGIGAAYNNDYDKYLDSSYHSTGIINMGDYFIYIRLPNGGDGLFKNLQLVTCKYSNGKEKVYNIFKQ